MANGSESRGKTYLSLGVRKYLLGLTPADLSLSNDFVIGSHRVGPNWVSLTIQDPSEAEPRHFEVRVTEKMGPPHG
jgi:hypothetical protein